MQPAGGKPTSTVHGFIGRVAIVASLWNESITKRLVKGAEQTLKEAGLASADYDLFWVPGAFELPQAAQTLARQSRYNAIVPVGCLIRGETTHFDYIAKAVAQGLDAVGRETGTAVSFGVLTVDTFDQAWARSGGTYGNKGEEAARAALKLATFQIEWKKHGRPEKSA